MIYCDDLVITKESGAVLYLTALKELHVLHLFSKIES